MNAFATLAEVLAGYARWAVAVGNALTRLRAMPTNSVDCVITSPPYYGQRDYGCDGQIGLEATPAEFIGRLTQVFAEVRRVLKPTGTLFVNIGDSYVNDAASRHDPGPRHEGRANVPTPQKGWRTAGLKKKDRIGIPHMLAFALRGDGWWWRDEVIWDKPNPLTESVQDRTTRAHEFVFLFTKCANYFWDKKAIDEPAVWTGKRGASKRRYKQNGEIGAGKVYDTRNKRSVWRVTPERRRFDGVKHFAAMPVKLVEPCVLAGCPVGGVVLDPFAGSGTTLKVAVENGRRAIGLELNPQYAGLIRERMALTECAA